MEARWASIVGKTAYRDGQTVWKEEERWVGQSACEVTLGRTILDRANVGEDGEAASMHGSVCCTKWFCKGVGLLEGV